MVIGVVWLELNGIPQGFQKSLVWGWIISDEDEFEFEGQMFVWKTT